MVCNCNPMQNVLECCSKFVQIGFFSWVLYFFFEEGDFANLYFVRDKVAWFGFLADYQ